MQYYSFWLKAIPDLPLLYFQGKETRKRIPSLLDATDNRGMINRGENRTISVLYLGESTIAGVGVESHKDGFSGHMSRELSGIYKCNVGYDVIAMSGWKAGDLYNHLIDWDPVRTYELVVVGLGGNDSFQFTSPLKWQSYIEKLISTVKDKCNNTPIIFCNLPPTSEFLAFPPILKKKIGDMTEILREALSETTQDIAGVYFNDEPISLTNWSKRHGLDPNPALYFSDGVHPSEITYRIWARESAAFTKASGIEI